MPFLQPYFMGVILLHYVINNSDYHHAHLSSLVLFLYGITNYAGIRVDHNSTIEFALLNIE